MALSQFARERLHELLSALSEGRLDEAQSGLLRQLLLDPDAQQYYVDFSMLDACLDLASVECAGPEALLSQTLSALRESSGLFGAGLECPSNPPQQNVDSPAAIQAARPLAPRSPVLGFLHTLLRVGHETPLTAALMWLVMVVVCSGLVLTIFFCVALIFHGTGVKVHIDGPEVAGGKEQGAGSREPAPPAASDSPLPAPRSVLSSSSATVARLIHISEPRWAIGSHSPHLGDDLETGRKLVLLSGLAEVMFQSGVRAVLEGPATMDIGSCKSAVLREGKLTIAVVDPDGHGFEVHTPGMKYTDLGTEFGVWVKKDGAQEMVVFRGAVQAEVAAPEIPNAESQISDLKSEVPNPQPPAPDPKPVAVAANQAIRVAALGKPIEQVSADEKQFVRPQQMAKIVAEQAKQSPECLRWKAESEKLRKDADLAAYYDFQPDESDRTVLRNRAASGQKLDGRIEGAEWAEGHLPGKRALKFSGSNDRVRVDIPGQYEALTTAVWINVETRAASILLSSRGGGPIVIPSGESGAWVHFAIVYDSRAKKSTYYKNGRAIGNHKFDAPISLVFGPSQIANREPVSPKNDSVINLRGRISELLLLGRALSADEIKSLYENSSGTAGTKNQTEK